MKTDHEDQQLIDKLKQLPKIEDHRNKDELFQRISSRMSEQQPPKQYKLIPIFSTLIVIVLVFALIPVFINIGTPETSVKDSADESYAVEESAENYDVELYSTEKDSDQADKSLNDHAVESYVLQNIDNDSTVIYGAVSDDQLQTVIPVTIVFPEVVDLDTHYNQLERYLEATNWGVNDYLFEHENFDIDLTNRKVLMNISDEFSLGEGSTHENIFLEILTAMFTPYQIEKVVFDEGVELGSIGEVSELPLQSNEKENYKVFQADEHHRKFLVPIRTEDNVTIEEAIQDMKKGQASFNIYPTIPKDVQLSFSTSDNELIITPGHERIFEDDQSAIIMIEAILMTAKSFGYEFVRFNDISKLQVGPYQLTDSIEVPDAINPVYR